jgi:ribonuclease E
LRDLGGLVVIDFIDMMAARNQREVESRLRDAVALDRARVQIGRISRFGLLEMSRQRLKPSLGEATQVVCPRCSGNGTIRTVESLALSLVRIAEEEALKESTGRVEVHVPVDVATFMLNEKRKAIADVESQTCVQILVIASTALETPQYRVERVRKDEMADSSELASYQQSDVIDQTYNPDQHKEKVIQPERAAVAAIMPTQPKPAASESESVVAEKINSKGFLATIVSMFKGEEQEKIAAEDKKQPVAAQGGNRAGRGRGQAQKGGARRRPAQSQQQDKASKGSKPKPQTPKGGGKSKQPALKEENKAVTAEKEEKAEQAPSSRRGRRGGSRRRRDNRDRPAGQEAQTQQDQSAPNQVAEAKSAPSQPAQDQVKTEQDKLKHANKPRQPKSKQPKPEQQTSETQSSAVPQADTATPSKDSAKAVEKPKRDISGNISASSKAATSTSVATSAATESPSPVAAPPSAPTVAPAPVVAAEPAKGKSEKETSSE